MSEPTTAAPPPPTSPASAPSEDYWGFEGDAQKWFFPDGKQYIEFKRLNEGEKTRFQQQTNRDITLERQSGNARVKMDPASERHALIEASVTGWNLRRGGEDVPFSKGSPGSNLGQWLQVANPVHVERLEFEIRKANPWLQAEMTVEEIDKQIADLTELRTQAVEREAGEGSSSVK